MLDARASLNKNYVSLVSDPVNVTHFLISKSFKFSGRR